MESKKVWTFVFAGREPAPDTDAPDPGEPTRPDTPDETGGQSGGGGGGGASQPPFHVIETDPGTTLAIGQDVTVRIYSPHGDLSLVRMRDGETLTEPRQTTTLNEVVIFSGSGNPSTQYPITAVNNASQTLYDQNGNNLEPSISNDANGNLVAQYTDGIYGFVNLNYSTSFAEFTFTETTPGVFFYLARCSVDGIIDTVQITWEAAGEEGDGTGSAATVTVQVVDYATQQPIAGAAVTIDGSYRGQTDGSGNISVGVLNPGTHTISATASGYIPTASDDLSNDSFVV